MYYLTFCVAGVGASARAIDDRARDIGSARASASASEEGKGVCFNVCWCLCMPNCLSCCCLASKEGGKKVFDLPDATRAPGLEATRGSSSGFERRVLESGERRVLESGSIEGEGTGVLGVLCMWCMHVCVTVCPCVCVCVRVCRLRRSGVRQTDHRRSFSGMRMQPLKSGCATRRRSVLRKQRGWSTSSASASLAPQDGHVHRTTTEPCCSSSSTPSTSALLHHLAGLSVGTVAAAVTATVRQQQQQLQSRCVFVVCVWCVVCVY